MSGGGTSVRLAALDVAGTTVQEHGLVYETLHAAVNAAGAAVDREGIAPWMGADKRQAVRELLGTRDAGPPAEAEVDRVHDDFRARLAAAYRERPPAPFPGVTEALAALRARGVRVALTTGFDRAVTEPLLAQVGWSDGAVDAVVCADDVPAGRPAPYMIFRAMELTGVRSVAEVLACGDTPLDLEAGTNAGARLVVGVLTGGADAATLGAVRHTHLLAAAADLPGLIARA